MSMGNNEKSAKSHILSKRAIGLLIALFVAGALSCTGCNTGKQEEESKSTDSKPMNGQEEAAVPVVQQNSEPEQPSTDEEQQITVENQENQEEDAQNPEIEREVNEAEDGTEDSKTAEYTDVYREVINKYCDELQSDNEPTFAYIYFNEDDIPDLVIDIPGYYVNLYVYSEGKAVPVLERAAYGAGGFAGYLYLPYESLMYEALSGMAGAERELIFTRCHLDGETVSSETEAECYVSYFKEVESSAEPAEVDFDNPHYEYYSDVLTQEEQIIERYQQLDERMREFKSLNGELTRDEFEKDM